MRVAHVTDLHFSPGTDPRLVAQALAILRAERPDLVVCTGDVVSRDRLAPMRAAFAAARAFREATAVPWLSVPGNHDLCDLDGHHIPELYRDAWEPQDSFSQVREGILFLGVSSGHADPDEGHHREWRKPFMGTVRCGDVSQDQVRFAEAALRQHSGPAVFCLHHHLVPIWNHMHQSCYNGDLVFTAAQLLDMLRRHRVGLVLGGHKHDMQVNVLNDTILVTGGSLLAPLPDGFENSMNLLELGPAGCLKIDQVLIPSGRHVPYYRLQHPMNSSAG